jgi:hypothetical protein
MKERKWMWITMGWSKRGECLGKDGGGGEGEGEEAVSRRGEVRRPTWEM